MPEIYYVQAAANGGWEVRREGASRPEHHALQREDAMKFAEELCKRRGARLALQDAGPVEAVQRRSDKELDARREELA